MLKANIHSVSLFDTLHQIHVLLHMHRHEWFYVKYFEWLLIKTSWSHPLGILTLALTFIWQYEQEILALRTAMEEMHHKLVTAEEQAQTRAANSEGSDAVPPSSPCDPRQRSSSTASPLTLHQHSRHSRQSPQCPLAQQTGDQAQMREMIQK